MSAVCSVAQLCPPIVTPWTVAHQAPLSRRSPWGHNVILQARILEWPFLPPGDCPHPGVKPTSVFLALQADSLPHTLHLLKAIKKKKANKVQKFFK